MFVEIRDSIGITFLPIRLLEMSSHNAPIAVRSLDEIVGLMIGFNLLVLLTFVGMVVYQSLSQPATGNFRLVSNRQAPELTLANKMRYHLFLSHVRCGSGTSLGHPPPPPISTLVKPSHQ